MQILGFIYEHMVCDEGFPGLLSESEVFGSHREDLREAETAVGAAVPSERFDQLPDRDSL